MNKHKFNLFDILIILGIVLVVGVMYYYTTARNSVLSNTEVTVEYIVELKTVRAEHIDKIVKGDKVVETVRDQQIGEVVNVEVSPAYNIATNHLTGEMYVSMYPDINNPEIPKEQVEGEVEAPEINDIDIQKNTPKYDFYNVKVTIRDNVKKSDNGYSINGFDIIVGELVHFRVPQYVSNGYCINIKEVAK